MQHEFKCEKNKTRLDKFLVENLPDLSRSKIQHIIENGNVKINGKVVNIKHFWLSAGDIIKITKLGLKQKKEKEEINEEIIKKINIIEANNDFVVLEKPAGLIVHQTKDIKEYSLVDYLKEKYPQIKRVGEEKKYRPGIVHRLDKNVSGLMVVALSQKMFLYLKKQFQERQTVKKYKCLVYGKFEKSEGVIDFPIVRSKRSGKMVAMPKKESERDALTYFFKDMEFGHYTFLDVQIKTGRSHQIRAHMHAIDHPIIGDDLYKSRKYKDNFNLNRIFLHAYHLEFQDLSGEKKIFEIKLAKELEIILNNLK